MTHSFILSAPSNFGLYRPQAFGRSSRRRFWGDRRARWAAYFGGAPSDAQQMVIDAAIGVEWDVRRLEAKADKDPHEPTGLVRLRGQYQRLVRELGVTAPTPKGSGPTLADFVAAHDRSIPGTAS